MNRFTLPAVAALVVLAPTPPAGATEEPDYAVVAGEGSFELRQYPAMLAAETVVRDSTFDDAGNVAFGRLFRYITGNNRAQADIAMTAPVVQSRERASDRPGEKIAMTAPVIQQAAPDGEPGSGYRVAFLVPAGYTRETVPEPLDPLVQIVVMPARLVAAIRYSGRTSAELNDRKEQALRSWMATRQLLATGDAISAQYNAPFIPGPFRRNEVLIPVTRSE
ncbi:MAG: heme-binding protein [Gammaproteobacteria bacterium]